MKIDDEAIYTIEVTRLENNHDVAEVSKALISLGIQGSKQKIRPVSDDQKIAGAIFIPRLFTRWKGQAQEELFQTKVREAVGSAQVSIEVKSWGHLPGYPMGDIL